MNQAIADKNREEFMKEIDQFETWMSKVTELTGMNDIMINELKISVVFKFRSGYSAEDFAAELNRRIHGAD